MASLSGVFSRAREQQPEKRAVMPPAAPPPVPRDLKAEEIIRELYDNRKRIGELLAEVAGLQQDLATERAARHAVEQQCGEVEDVARRLQYANTRIVTKGDVIITLISEFQAELMANNIGDPVPHVPNIPPRRRVDLSALEAEIRRDAEELRGEQRAISENEAQRMGAERLPIDEPDAQELYGDEGPAGAHVHGEGSVR